MDSNQRKQQENDESTEEEIIEDISKIDEYTTESDSDDIPIFLNEDTNFGEKNRQLFDIEDEDRLFLEDVDKILSPVNIAKHFQAPDVDDVKENIVPSNSDKSIKPSKSEKELSPLNDDVILINDKKVSLSSLKKNQEVPFKNDRQFSSLNYPKPPNVSLRTSHSLDIDLHLSSEDSSLNESIENENSVDEIEEKNSSIIQMSNESNVQKNIGEKTITLRNEESQPVVKKMEKITPDYFKEPLDDITEESETESRDDKANLIEKGSQCRSILQNSLFMKRTNIEDEHEQSHSLDLQNKSVKELQDLVIEKDSCLDALNLQLSALIRRENLKEGGRESLKESVPYSFATTTSTEYRTLNEDFNIKILDIENELHERATFIEQLQTQLAESLQEKSKLSEEIMELKSKIAGIESIKSSDDENTMISASRINDFKNSLPEDEAVCFSKVWIKFEQFHKGELNQLKQNHDQELKHLQEMMKNDKKDADVEVNRLRQLLSSVKSDSPVIDDLRRELETKHAKEMEELREYFEKRCVDMEKQYSEEVFSQHSRKVEESLESDNETLPDEEMPHESPRKIARVENNSSDDKPGYRNVQELESYYLDRIDELQKYHDEVVKGLKLKLQHYESNFDHGKGFSLPPQYPNPSSQSHAFLNDFNPYNELQKIKAEYDQRLEEQVALAREDVLHEIENNIKTLISENSRDDSTWPPELILLREKLTATNQLEIAQLKIKHEEEMARMKSEYDIQLKRKLKRHAAFDAHRDLDKIISERDSLRDLSESLRFTLCELAKYFTQYDDELNNTINEELNKSEDLNVSANISNTTKQFITFKPDISSLITIVEDPQLLEFISKTPPVTENENYESSNGGGLTQINIVDCLGRLKAEANNILGLSEQLYKWSHQKLDNSIDKLSDKTDSCEEEDGLKRSHCKSLEVYDKNADKANNDDIAQSLPAFFEDMKANELQEKLIELKNQLIKSEEERRDLRKELNEVLKRSVSLECELKEAKNQLEGKETVTEGFGTQSPLHTGNKKKNNSSLVELQEKAKGFLASSSNNSTVDNAVALQQLIEGFCRETDFYIENDKRDRDDLQNQLEMADKQLKANRKFMEEQAAEREQERDEFSKELDKLRVILKEKDKDKTSHENYEKEISNFESQIKELNAQVQSFNEQKVKYEEDLKASIDKVFDLREIIADLESQIQTKTLKENVLEEKCKELENYIELQNQANESLKEEADVEGKEYIEKIRYLEDQLKLVRPSNEQRLLIDQMTSQLKTIEMLLDRKTKTLEAFHALASTCSTTCSSPCEDVSRGIDFDSSEKSPLRIPKLSPDSGNLPFEEVQRILEKLSKHNRVEEATVKKVTDLEMTINVMKNNFSELQQEKDILQERMSEQLMKISSLQTRLDEQRIRAEELNKQSTSDLTLRVHDLQNELSSLRETLSSRDKQIANLNQLLEHSKKIIDRQDHELAFSGDNDKSLYEKLSEELKRKNEEIERLKEKIKSEMINKAVIPDLMETMIAEKNEEIDSLKEQLSMSQNQTRNVMKSTPPSSITCGTVLSMISECDEPDVLRKMIEPEAQIALTSIHNLNPLKTLTLDNQSTYNHSDMETDKATIFTSHDGNNTDIQMPSHLIPRRINFTSSADESSLNFGDINKLKFELEKITREKNDEINELKMQVQQQSEEISNLQVDVQAKSKLYAEVKEEKKKVENELDDLRLSIMKLSAYEMTVKKKDEELSNLMTKIEQLEMTLKSQNQDLDNLRTVLVNRDETIQQLNEDVTTLQNKCKENEKVLIDLERLKKQVNSYNDVMVEKETMLKKLELDLLKYVKSERELLEKAEQCDQLLEANQRLENDVENLRHELCVKAISLEKCKIDIEEMEKQSKSDEHVSIEEIASKLDRELNYSAELDTNIAKAIESESEINSELEELGGKRPSRYSEKIHRLEKEVEELRLQHVKLLTDLEEERKHTDEIHMQDAMLMESMNARLKAALENETVLKRLLESERQKTIQLSSHLTGIQRTKSFDNNLLFGKPLTPESPRRLAKLNELESEVVLRLESEIKLLTSQNDCERDRVSDLQKVLDRERERFNKAIAEQQNYCDQLKREVQRLQNDKQMLENEIDQMQEYKHKYYELEKEKYRMDSGNFNVNEVPREFMQKLEKINKALDDNVRENHQMNETLQKLINERHALQQRIAELESTGSSNNLVHYSTNVRDLEEQNNYLIARFMRSESFRKALIFQKRFILVTLASTIGCPQGPLFKCNPKKRKSFRSIVFMVIAIERFKFIARRWTGKRMMAKVMYTATTTPKRSQSASNNNWATFARLETMGNNNLQIFNRTPPTRERTGFNLLPSTSHQQPQSKQSPIQRLQSLFQDTH